MKYVLDTNVLISNPYSIYSYIESGSEIIIAAATMEELDHLKSKERTAHEARLAIRLLSKAILGQNYEAITQTGVSLNLSNPAVPESVTLKIVDYVGEEEFPLDKQDARIIATCIQQGATLVTRDINMLLIAMSKGCPVLQYTGDDSLKDSDVLYSGYIELPLFWETVEVLEYVGPYAIITYSSLPDADFYPNQYILSDGEIVGRVVAAGEFQLEVLPIKHEQALKRKLMKTIQPRDALQASFVDAILDKNNDVVTIMGAAGSGKTMLAVAGAMHMVNAGHFANLMYVKADSPMSGEIGFLPGTLGEKLRPSVEPCITSLNILFKDQPEVDKYVEGLLEKGVVQFPSLYYFRGRSIGHPDPGKGSVLIVDECQNLSNHEIKSIISRCGENTLLILCGNIKQIDNPRNTAVNNGFVYAVEKLKEYDHASHIILNTVYRGRLAAFVEDNF
ncbi:PhoH-like phosphate starvation-inducible [Citrobacter phage Miller]|uniref:PhoH family protein n=1 Tax=Citrobacter phage Miller TaxID=1527524 RepID=A0A076YPG1_9CAUD|nr:PhoH-like phosphate starvation-inducible [Citrobacter phage Miller]AIK68091.1 PhoH family protein [Citrobacter phage Miller]